MLKKFTALFMIAILTASLTACGTVQNQSTATTAASSQTSDSQTDAASTVETGKKSSSNPNAVVTTANVTSNGVINATELFTERDLTQNYDESEAQAVSLTDGQTVNITKAGVYVLSGTASNVTVTVEAGDEDKVQIVLDGVNITNTGTPCIYVKNADKVFVTTQNDNSLTVTGAFTADGETNTDAVIFSKDDLVLNGTGTLTIQSSDNGVSCKDDLKITGGTINITSTSDGLEANESLAVADGNITINTPKDAIHVENDEDTSTGYIYICGGTMNITAGDDGVRATTVCQIDGGTLTIDCAEGIEATYVQINGGTVTVNATDDGINATNKSSDYAVTAEFTGGEITVNMGQGDTDGIDSNGNLYVKGGTLNINAQSPFDFDGQSSYTGGTIIVNGTETNTITNQMMGGGMRGGMDGGMPGGDMGGMPMR